MNQALNQEPVGARQLHDYAEVRGLVDKKEYAEALSKLNGSQLSQSTKEQLQRALESDDEYVINRTFGELDARIMQALCWACWKE